MILVRILRRATWDKISVESVNCQMAPMCRGSERNSSDSVVPYDERRQTAQSAAPEPISFLLEETEDGKYRIILNQSDPTNRESVIVYTRCQLHLCDEMWFQLAEELKDNSVDDLI